MGLPPGADEDNSAVNGLPMSSDGAGGDDCVRDAVGRAVRGRNDHQSSHSSTLKHICADAEIEESSQQRQEAVEHNVRVARLIESLGESGAGRRAVLRAITEMQGLSEDETEDIISGKQETKVNVPHSLRGALCSIGLGDMLAPVNIFTIAGDADAILLNETWKDIEFEVALDSGSVVHVCSLEDVPGYKLSESPGSRRGQEFLMGDGGTIPNLGQSQLNLSDCNVGRDIQSVFQIAAVTRPLMSVGFRSK